MFKASPEYKAHFAKFGAREDLSGLRDMRGDIQNALNIVQRRKVQHFKISEPLRDAEKALLRVIFGINEVIEEKEEVKRLLIESAKEERKEWKNKPASRELDRSMPTSTGIRNLPFFQKD